MEHSEADVEVVNVNIRDLPVSTWRAFRAIAIMKGYSTSELVARVLGEYVKAHPLLTGVK